MPESDNGAVGGTAAEAPPHGARLGGRSPGALSPRAVARAMVAAPLARRAQDELAYCLLGLPLGLAGLLAVLVPLAAGAALSVTVLGTLPGLALVAAALGIAHRLGRLHLRLAARLAGARVAVPTRRRPGAPRSGVPRPGPLRRLAAALRDVARWRAVAYLVLKLPVGVLCWYAAACWLDGLVNLSYPLWWYGFRNHPAGVQLSPARVFTVVPMTSFGVSTFAGTLAVAAIGALTLLLAPWVTRGVVAVDRALVRGLLGPGALAERVRDLEESRALAVDDSAAMLRRLERDLHDGAQARLVALALSLGMAKEKLGADGQPLDAARVRELVDSAHSNATQAIAELHDLARGIHPAALDRGLADALATLTACSSVPVRLSVQVPVRPTAAIESIAYFCAAELVANVIKHSHAERATLEVWQQDGTLRLRVSDDGRGGANPGAGSGLTGLAHRVRTVDGRLAIASPRGGPTVVTVELPMHA